MQHTSVIDLLPSQCSDLLLSHHLHYIQVMTYAYALPYLNVLSRKVCSMEAYGALHSGQLKGAAEGEG